MKIGASLALNGSADFARYCDGTMLMGDLVLTENELPKATEALQEAGIEQTALHKHLPDQKPPSGGHTFTPWATRSPSPASSRQF